MATMSTVPLGDWVELRDEPTRGGRVVQLVNRRDSIALNLTPAEADSVTTGRLQELPTALREELHDGGFLAGSAALPTESTGCRLVQTLSTLEFTFTRVDGFVAAVYRVIGRHLFTPVAVGCHVLLALAGVVALGHALTAQSVTFRVAPGQVPTAIGIGLVAIVIHELAHAVALTRYGCRVDSIGVGVHLGSPVFFVQSVDGLLLTRRQRIVQAAAGPWAEWVVTSLIALAYWANPSQPLGDLLHRFVVLNAIVIATNLLPFVGLDGSHLFSDLIRMPDLAARSVGAVDRLIAAPLAGHRPSREDVLLAGYRVLNAAVAAGLIALSVLMWIALFGPTLASLAHDGPRGWLWLAVLGVVFGRPALRRMLPTVARGISSVHDLGGRAVFRLEWSWRIAATEILAASPSYRGCSDAELGVIAGRLVSRRVLPGQPVADGGAVLRRGAVITDLGRYGPGEFIPGGAQVWAARRAVLAEAA